MATAKPPREIPHVEPVPIAEEFASGLAFYEKVDGVTYLVFYVDHVLPPEFAGGRERKITRRIIMPNDGVARMVRMLDSDEDH